MNDIYGTATVADVNGSLTVTVGKRPATINLSPWDGNTFAATRPAYDPVFDGKATFSTGSDGTIRYLNITTLGEEPGRPETFDRTGV